MENCGGTEVDWQGLTSLMGRLAPLRGRWDVAILASLGPDESGTRPGDLLELVNAQVPGGRLSWKVMEETLRRLEGWGYVGRREISRSPRESRYWLLPPAGQLMEALEVLDAWFAQQAPPGNGAAPAS
jgi:DNA-binding HxlR family transcriptional regulator